VAGTNSTRPLRERQIVKINVDGEGGPFLGAVVGPFGLLPFTTLAAQQLAASLPPDVAGRFYFIGLDVEVIARILAGKSVRARPIRKAKDGTRIGPDGLAVAPLARVSPTAAQI
jgi:hypothetical protein